MRDAVLKGSACSALFAAAACEVRNRATHSLFSLITTETMYFTRPNISVFWRFRRSMRRRAPKCTRDF